MTRQEQDDLRWLALSAKKGLESSDHKTKIGCIIVRPDKSILSEACNTFPEGVVDTIEKRKSAPDKYFWIEHAERNAIYAAARLGISTAGATLFVEITPCVDCARAIIQAGLVEVVINHDRTTEYRSERYSSEHSVSLEMLAEAGIPVRFVSPRLISGQVEVL
ncbi:MAG: deaminase [Acidobacteria bacterium]|nr:deaminase [Acidobacteriota bacterium]